jgi:hypothetical protein
MQISCIYTCIFLTYIHANKEAYILPLPPLTQQYHLHMLLGLHTYMHTYICTCILLAYIRTNKEAYIHTSGSSDISDTTMLASYAVWLKANSLSTLPIVTGEVIEAPLPECVYMCVCVCMLFGWRPTPCPVYLSSLGKWCIYIYIYIHIHMYGPVYR